MFEKSYVSVSVTDSVNSKTYAFGKINGSIITDVDKNGFIDIVTFPSNFTESVYLKPVIWLNTNGKFTPTTILGDTNYQFIRDSISGDFNRDGYEDYVLIDTGWELDNRSPDSLYGATPVLLQGTPTGLKWVDASSFISARDGGKTFNHIGSSADYDGDGDLDVAIAAFTPKATNQFRLYKNDGTGKFTWQEGAVDLPNGDPSGATFIKLEHNWSLVTGSYRSFSSNDSTGYEKPWVLTYNGAKFSTSYELNRPDLGGRERNYGAADMYNRDLNGDGREDLIILWETEAVYGIDDGLSNIEKGAFGANTRYADLSDTIAAVYMQNADGSLEKTPSVYNLQGHGTGWHIYFLDFNNDGCVDFYNSSHGINPSNYQKAIWLNDGTGKFKQITSSIISESFESWYQDTPYFFDANNDGQIDIVSLRGVFGNDFNTRNIGEELRVFINNTPQHRQVNPVISQVYQLYKTIFDREPDVEGAKYWISKIENGLTLAQAADFFVGCREFVEIHGVGNNQDLLLRCYQNVLGRDPDAGGYEWWAEKMQHNADVYTPSHVVSSFMHIADDLNIVGVQPINPEIYL